MIETRAKLTNVKVSPKKARLIADAVRGLTVAEALVRLPVMYKTTAPLMLKLIKSAAANAYDQYEVAIDDLVIKSVIVNKGLDLKRWQPAAFGRAHPFKRHFSHIEVVLAAKEGVKAVKKEKIKEVETVKLSEVADAAKKDKTDKKSDKKADSKASLKSTANRQATRIDKHTTNK